ncbi:DUF5994 family protein [Streptomyces sp. NPDC048309]|uniref:DUF5994 family protein n=1 Tax=Streptomyces sp. NPDC048309 TaxID=3154618 RepID=UPI003408253A
MSATTDHAPPRMVPFRAPTARLALKPVSTTRRLLDGAWWPRSRNLVHELSALADVLDPLWGRITRIAVNPTYWTAIPSNVAVNGHLVKIDRFTRELDPHEILLLSYTAGRWDLLVIPPRTSASVAARLMTAASESTGPPRTASALMAAEQALRSSSVTDRTQHSEETWEDDDATSHSVTEARRPAVCS